MRYSILMSFEEQDAIPVPDLAEQWGTSQQVVMGLINGALSISPDGSVAKQMDTHGFTPAVRPKWFGSTYTPPVQKGSPKDVSAGSPAPTGLGQAPAASDRVYSSVKPQPIGQQ
ncbi:hypothetical protein IH574_06840, partial [Candidatus Bathyarchaeota archaeon]|nr:hypothetical protein [Candidatus Bathyarchaeota archaeon]